VPRERRRFEIRKQLENGKAIVAGILGWLFVGSGIVVGALIERKTFANVAAFAVAAGICLAVAVFAMNWVFRRIELRRLRREFPTGQE
jgi:hypothetical protein